jgi:hypothetical protein
MGGHTMEIAIYKFEETQEKNLSDDSNPENIDIAIAIEQAQKGYELAQKLCFNEQTSMYQRQIEALRKRIDPCPPYYKLSESEMNRLEKILPRAYVEKKIYFYLFDLAKYRFDLIPTRVLSEIDHVRQKQYFDFLRIYTPERSNKDPVLIGIRVVSEYPARIEERYLIARWGEENLLPLKEMLSKKQGLRRFFRRLRGRSMIERR